MKNKVKNGLSIGVGMFKSGNIFVKVLMILALVGFIFSDFIKLAAVGILFYFAFRFFKKIKSQRFSN